MGVELPSRIKTSIQSIDSQNIITLTQPIPKGRSGIVVHSYGNGLFAITHSAISLGGTKASISKFDMLKHDNMPTVKTAIQREDQVIFGNLYNNALLIAPNEQVYASLTKSIKKVWIHPDIYASYLIINKEDRMTIKNLKEFAIDNQVGLVVIVVKDGLKILDPISGKYILKVVKPLYTTKTQSPFFARFEQIRSGIFTNTSKANFLPYYKGVESIR
jgi:hypothetical protein